MDTLGADLALLPDTNIYISNNETTLTNYMKPENSKADDLNCNLASSNVSSSTKSSKPKPFDSELDCSQNEEESATSTNPVLHTENRSDNNESGSSISIDLKNTIHESIELVEDSDNEVVIADDTINGTIETCTSEISNSLEKRKVKFPEDDSIVTGFLEPHDPWASAKPCSAGELIDWYKWTCEKHQARPIPILLEQLQGINLELCNDRYDMLSLKGIRLDHKHIETLEEILKRVQFKTLDFENTNLDDDMAISLFDMVEYYESCSKLNIAMNPRITFRGFQTCSRMMKKNNCLETLDLRGIIFADISMPALARSLRVGCSLSVLHLENCNICGRNLLILVSAIKMNENLRELYLSNNKMMTTDGIQLGALLKINRRLQLLDVRNNNLGDVGASHLCDGLYEQTGESGLLSLSLWSNSLTHLGMPAMAQALKRCLHLQTLNLANNAITSEGAHYLREGLLCNRSLLRLSLYGCKISCEGAVALAEYIADTKQLLRLDLRENDVRTGGLMALSLALKVNTSLSRLDLDREPKKDPGVKDYLQSQRDSMQQIESHLRRNRVAACELAERQLEEEASKLSAGDVSSTILVNGGVIQRPNHLELEIEIPAPSPSSDDSASLAEDATSSEKVDSTSEEFDVSPVKFEKSWTKQSRFKHGGCTPSPTVDHLGKMVVSPTDEALNQTEASCYTGKKQRVVGMRSEMKMACSGRTFLVTTTVFDEESADQIAGAGAAEANIDAEEDGAASKKTQQSKSEDCLGSDNKQEFAAEASGETETSSSSQFASLSVQVNTSTTAGSSADDTCLNVED